MGCCWRGEERRREDEHVQSIGADDEGGGEHEEGTGEMHTGKLKKFGFWSFQLCLMTGKAGVEVRAEYDRCEVVFLYSSPREASDQP